MWEAFIHIVGDFKCHIPNRLIIYISPARQQGNITQQCAITHHSFLEFLLFSIKNLARKHGSERKGKIMNNKSRLEEILRVAAAKETRILAQMIGPSTADAQANLEADWEKVWSRLSAHLEPFFRLLARILTIFDKKFRILTCRLFFCDKPSKWITVTVTV